MIIGVPKETIEGEKRVALIPESVAKLKQSGNEVIVAEGAGVASGFSDADYSSVGSEVVAGNAAVFGKSEVIVKVREPSVPEVNQMKEGAVLVSFIWPHQSQEVVEALVSRKLVSFAMDRVPRITRAQTMDALSSQSNLAGYKCVLVAANELPRVFPMMMTAAGTLSPAKVFILGAGVAGLQAIATARRLGAVVEAYDVRPVVKEQVESLGAKFVELQLDTSDSQDKGGYAKDQGEEFLRKQREMMLKHIAASDVVITTALIPGKKAPVLVTEEMVKGMKAGSVVVDLAAEQGGNCELSEPGKIVEKYGVKIVGMKDVPSQLAQHSSQMYSRNILAFLQNMIKEGKLELDTEDEIIRDSMVTRDGRKTYE